MKLTRLGGVLALATSVAMVGCGDQKKNPFATENVSVAPQVEGRAPAPTPIEAPTPAP
jgi:hypothetical protein